MIIKVIMALRDDPEPLVDPIRIRAGTITNPCYAFPTIFEALTIDNRPVYVRYRGSHLRVHVGDPGETISQVDEREPIFRKDVGEPNAGFMTWDELLQHVNITVEM